MVLDPDGNIVLSGPGAVMGLSPTNGTVVWQVDRSGIGGAVAAGHDRVVASTWDSGIASLVALDDAGEVRWQSPVGADFRGLALDRDAVVATRGGAPGEIVRLDRGDGSELWRVAADVYGPPSIDASGDLYFPGPGILSLGADGRERFTGDPPSGALALGASGLRYGWGVLTDELGDQEFAFMSFSSRDGSSLWQGEQFDAVDSSNGSPNLIGGRVYFAGGLFASGVYAFRGGPGLAKAPWPRAEGGADNGYSEQ